MRLRVEKWGNSLALRIPKPFAEEVRVKQGTKIDLSLADGRLVVTPVSGKNWTLAKLLAGVTTNNMHVEADFGPAVGREVW